MGPMQEDYVWVGWHHLFLMKSFNVFKYFTYPHLHTNKYLVRIRFLEYSVRPYSVF